MSQPIEIHTSIEIPAALARTELLRIMSAIHGHQAPYEDAVLRVGLHDLRMPLPGDVSIPIEAEVQSRPLQYECGIKIAAGGSAEFFPKFSGTITISALGSGVSEMWLQGDYVVPLGALGEAIDATLLNGTAKRSLAAFLDMLADTLTANVKSEQESEVRRGTARARV
jgi:hypothetical protein